MSKQETLYDRLKTGHKETLENKVKNEYPSIYETLVGRLNKNVSVLDLSYSEVLQLSTFLGRFEDGLRSPLHYFNNRKS